MTYKIDYMYRNPKGVLINIEDIDDEGRHYVRIYEHPVPSVATLGLEKWCEVGELLDYKYSTEPECYFFDYRPL